MKIHLQKLSVAALIVGVAIALYSWQAQTIANFSADRQAQAQADDAGFQTPQAQIQMGLPALFVPQSAVAEVSVADRALGMGFGFGIAFLGMAGISTALRLPSSPTP